MKPGFFFREAMRGSYWRVDAPTDERAIELRGTLRARDARRFLLDRVWHLDGEIDIEGFATNRPVDGTVTFRLFDERRMPYRARFVADDGRSYELRGQKEWTPIAPVDSISTLPASIYDDAGREFARVTLRFDVRNDVGRLLKSFRLSLRG
jgi:hypothetical protein